MAVTVATGSAATAEARQADRKARDMDDLRQSDAGPAVRTGRRTKRETSEDGEGMAG
ncbi:hypothetical protein LBMAG53_01960 [Planctomycetota bacterium]|nr:hypothetical protein LBMAG53_01960 [Planctomycetota bacterium]